MGLCVKWTFENESIFYAGEPFIIYLTLSCNSERKTQTAPPPQPSFLSSVFGIFSPATSTASSPAVHQPHPLVKAENSRKKNIIFVPKSQQFIQNQTSKVDNLQETVHLQEVHEAPLKIELSSLKISTSQSLENDSISQSHSKNAINGVVNAKTLQTEKPPSARPASIAINSDVDTSQESKGSMQESLQEGSEEIAWVFAQMQGNFKDTMVKIDSFKSLENKITYRIDGGSSGGGFIGGGALTASNTNLGSPSQPRPRKKLDSYPIYSTPPSIIVSDLRLKPGESRTFKYEILLPPVLPPSFNGKCSRFSYRLILGIQKANMSLKSHIVKIPIRIFNRTNDDGTRHVYEILNPIMVTVDESIIKPCDPDFQNLTDINRTEQQKVSLLPSTGSESRLPSLLNIQQICSHSQRAKLILLRGSYRLGDSVVGLINFEKSSVPTIETSVYLETVETVDPRFSLQTKAYINSFSLKLFSEAHKFTLHTKRMSFVLALPLDGCPDFQTTAVGYSWHLRFEFITGTATELYTAIKTEESGNFVESSAKPLISSDSFDCIIPIKVYGVRKGLRKWKSQKYDMTT